MNFATVNGVSLRYEFRAGSGVPLVLLHEMGGTLESWDLVLRAMPDRAILRFDMRGLGLSEKPTDDLAMDDMTGDVIALMDHVGIERAHLAGCAVGGGVAIAAAARLDERAVSLTAMAPATGVPPERRAAVLGLADMLATNGLRDFLETDTIPGAWPPEHFDRDGEGFAIFQATQFSTSPEALARTYRMLAQLDLKSDFERITCPMTLVAGTHDVMRTPKLIAELAASVGARFVEVDSGHFMALQSPEKVAALLSG